MKVIVEVLAVPAMLGKAPHTRTALAIMADASEVAAACIGEKDVSTEIDGLSRTLEAPASTSKLGQIHRMIDRHKNIGIFWDCFCCR